MDSNSHDDEEQQCQDEIRQDQFLRLPDHVVMLIINKLIYLKTLLRFSLVAKRYFSLVSQTDTLFVDIDSLQPSFLDRVGGFRRNLVANFTSASSPHILDPDSQKLSAISRGFQQVKRLHLHLRDNPSSVLNPFEIIGSVTAFGSHLEFCKLLIAKSVDQSNTSVRGGNHGLSNEDLRNEGMTLIHVLEKEMRKQKSIAELVLNLKMLETVVFTDCHLGGFLAMGKEQIARLKGNHEALAEPAYLRAYITYVPTLNLPESGYTLNNVVLISAFTNVQDDENAVEEATKVSYVDVSEKWDVFNEAIRQIVNEDRQPMGVILVPYCDILH